MLQLDSSCLLLYLTDVTYRTGSDGKTIVKMIKKEVKMFLLKMEDNYLQIMRFIYSRKRKRVVIDVKHRGKRVKLSKER